MVAACCTRAGERPRHEIQRDIKVKERARELLAKRYSSSRLSDEDILQCIYSISDNNSYLLFNRESCHTPLATRPLAEREALVSRSANTITGITTTMALVVNFCQCMMGTAGARVTRLPGGGSQHCMISLSTAPPTFPPCSPAFLLP